MIMGFDCHVKDPKSLLSCWLCQLTIGAPEVNAIGGRGRR